MNDIAEGIQDLAVSEGVAAAGSAAVVADARADVPQICAVVLQVAYPGVCIHRAVGGCLPEENSDL